MLPESQIYHLLLPVAGLSLHAAATHIYVLNLGGILWNVGMYGCTVRTVEAVQPPLCERVCRRSAKRRFTGSHRAWGGEWRGGGFASC